MNRKTRNTIKMLQRQGCFGFDDGEGWMVGSDFWPETQELHLLYEYGDVDEELFFPVKRYNEFRRKIKELLVIIKKYREENNKN